MSGATWKITATSDADEFLDYLDRVEHSFVHMIRTMEDVAEVIKENTIPLTPVETTRLGKSYKWTVLTDNSRMKVLQIRMSALNPKTGYDYAWIQHENTRYNHNKRDKIGANELSQNKVYKYHGSNYFNSEYNWTFSGGGPFYLKKGIQESEEGAFEMIEEDYLSLFSGGYF